VALKDMQQEQQMIRWSYSAPFWISHSVGRMEILNLPRRSSRHDGTSVMHPVVNPAEARGLIGPDYLAAALADLAASVQFVIFPGGVQLVLSLLDTLRVDDVAE
jgi:hypothetical protein